MYNAFLGVNGLLYCMLSLASKLPLNEEDRIILSCLLPACWLHITALMLLLHLYQRFPAYFICRPVQVSLQTQTPSNSEFRTALLRLYRPLRKRLTPLLYIFRLCSQLRGSPLVWQHFLSQAPTLSCQPFPGVICMSAVLHSIYSTQHQHSREHITSHQVPTQSRPAV